MLTLRSADVLTEVLSARFPRGYWQNWFQEYGHEFFQMHLERTRAYYETFGLLVAGKQVLEIGGFPGLLTALYLALGSKVTAIDSPFWTRDYYRAWAEEHQVVRVEHEILHGAPPLGGMWDVAVMSDVLLHLRGFPKDFVRWVVRHSRRFILCWTPGTGSEIVEAHAGTMQESYVGPSSEAVVEEISSYGAALEWKSDNDYRQILSFCRVG